MSTREVVKDYRVKVVDHVVSGCHNFTARALPCVSRVWETPFHCLASVERCGDVIHSDIACAAHLVGRCRRGSIPEGFEPRRERFVRRSVTRREVDNLEVFPSSGSLHGHVHYLLPRGMLEDWWYLPKVSIRND